LGKIQVNIQIYEEKKETNKQIKLAEDVKEEILDNKQRLTFLLPELEELKKNEEYRIIIFEKAKVELALESLSFGNKIILNQLRLYKAQLFLIEKNLENIEKSTKSRNFKVRNEGIGSAERDIKILLYGSFTNYNLDNLLEEIENYIKERKEYYSKIDKKIEENLLLDLKN